ncbi:MAG: dihydrolipoyllysine-residue acetyltransferase [Kangiellaceae bacterium]|nr:dihydrolipoyllysine-residue acetyltransferase [Kangiellaceae bacterium]
MSNLIPVNVPDIGDVSDVDIIEVLVSVGDTIAKEDSLITLETDKATMDVPSNQAGVVKAIHVNVGDQVSQGDLILEIEASGEAEAPSEKAAPAVTEEVKPEAPSATTTEAEPSATPAQAESEEKDLVVPDIGDASDVDVIEVLFGEGDSVEKEQGLITLETDKATMDVPSPDAGTVVSVSVKVGDKVSQGDVIGRIKTSIATVTESAAAPVEHVTSSTPASAAPAPKSVPSNRTAPVPEHPQMKKKSSGGVVHASPAVRRFARELGADLAKVKGSGPKGRILKEDVHKFIKFELSRPKATAATGAFSTPQMPEVDHAKWGEVETKPLTRIQKISSVNLHRNWISIPHVTQHEDADITELDAFRKSMKEEAARDGVRLTPLAFIMKGLVHTLKAFPKFNSSLANDGENLIIKNYYHIGVAVDTPNGLTVPVIRNVDQKGIYELANDLGEISAKAREGKLSADDMQGSSFTISSLGGIGGTAFTPIVKWPDVAILGLSRNKMQPVWNGKEFVPRLMLPMSLSYDHRVIDGADAARFSVHLAETLKDIRRVLLN